ncbi:MAG TPA: bifunctional diguanylate cyclase/phosphodiesterase [Steroidobacteraceae bacterium]|nr:bifunctional diguanylate cyclase/phosphodiesterase [Steroidobacteraceae bacterium]
MSSEAEILIPRDAPATTAPRSPRRLEAQLPCVAFLARIAPGAALPRFRYVSAGCHLLFGVEAQVMISDSAAGFAAVPERYRKSLWQSFCAATKLRRTWVHEFPVQAGQRTRWIEVRATFHSQGSEVEARGYFTECTALVHARAESRRLQRRFARVFAAAPSAMAVVDDADRVVAVNPAYVSLFGYTREEIPTLIECFERLFPDATYRAQIMQRWRDSLAGACDGAPATLVVGRVRRKDGAERVVEARTTLAGRERIITFSDITARVRAEMGRERATSERDRLRSELHLQCERMPMALVVSDATADLTIQSWNPAAETIFGYRSEEVLGRSPYDFLIPVERRPHVRNALDWETAGDETIRVVNEVLTKDGRTIWCEWFNTPMRDATGKVTRVLAMAQDVTARLGAEQQLRLWSTVLSHSVEGIFICDREQRILQVNSAFERITGYGADEAVGKTPRLLQSGRQGPEFYSALWSAVSATGSWSGEIWNRRKNGEVYLEWLSISAVCSADGSVAHFLGVFSDITERKSAEERVAHLARFDALTDLPNRTLLTDRLEQAVKSAQRAGTRVGVAFIDLDRFKEVNDSLGHNAGDVLLQELAGRLTRAVREVDTVARMGGDEFVVVLQNLQDAEDATACVNGLLQSLRRPVTLEGHEITVTASVGISMFPDDAENAQELLRNADAAMYQAKGDGRDGFHFYTGTLNRRALNMLSMENALRRALDRQEFVLHYQPQVRVATGELIGAEALIRWNHPERGLVMPGTFIPIAEERGLIRAIDEWVFGEAIRQLGEWQSRGFRSVPLALNVSTVPFHEKDFVERVARTMAACGVGADRLELELTESLMMRDVDASVAVMKRLHAMGIRLSIDDFGTGYSSLNYLRRLPIHKIKIDQSFVKEMLVHADGCRLVDGILGLAKSLGLTVVAEGVESNEQLRLLGARDCDEAQGFLFSPAVPVTDFEGLVANWTPFGRHGAEIDHGRALSTAPAG